MIKLLLGLCSSVVVSAAPALVWTGSSRESATVYTSDEVLASSLFENDASSSTPLQVVFLLGRGTDGSESFTRMAPFLTRVAQNSANFIHSHVSGVESIHSMVRNAGKTNKVAVIGLNDLGTKFNAAPLEPQQERKNLTKKSREIGSANVLLVDVGAETTPDALDSAVHEALSHADRVVLTAVRSIDEVKEERVKLARRRMELQYQAGAAAHMNRRLENNQNQQAANINQDQAAGVYFVQMTPNILAGILFFFLFATIAWIGISCMGMIATQDTYVKKMPAVGREA
jgi:hypothetical protein